MDIVCAGGKECIMAPKPSKLPIFGNHEKWDYWVYNTAALLGKAESLNAAVSSGNGQWFSLLKRFEGTYFRNAAVVKSINAECQRLALHTEVRKLGKACFDSCPHGEMNISTSPCWISCFFDTTLGQG